MKEEKNWIKVFIFVVCAIIAYKLFDNYSEVASFFGNLISILTPFLIGVLVAYIFYFPCKRIEKALCRSKRKIIQKKARTLAVAITYLIAFLILLILFNVVLPTLSKSLIDLATNLPNYYKNVTEYVENQPSDSLLNQIGAKEIIHNLEQIDIKKWFSIDNIINYVKGAIGIVNSIFSFFVTIVVSIYILLERTQILKFINRVTEAMFSRRVCYNIGKYFSKTNEVFYKFISSQIIDSIVIGTILSVAMLIMNVKYAILLGFMIGLFNIIPYFGAIIAVAITLIITALTGGFTQALWTGIVIIILQQIDANIINPKIVGNSLTLSPLLVIFAVTVGGAYFGVLGMFLAVPVITVIKIIVTDYIEYKRNKKINSEKI